MSSCNATGLEFGPTNPIGNTAPVKFYSLDASAVVKARMTDPARITVEEANVTPVTAP